MTATPESSGTVAECWRYPVKSFQGLPAERIEIGPAGPVGDRAWGIVDAEGRHVLSAKSAKVLLEGRCTDESLTLPDGRTFALATGDVELDAALSDWLGRPVRLARPTEVGPVSYEMTFDPPDDSAEYFEIPTPSGTFVDLAHLHIVTTATLSGAAAARPDLDWDVRRFRPNLVLDVDGPLFVEQTWAGREVRAGGIRVRIDQATVRCAMPLRAQPDGLEHQPGLFRAMSDLNTDMPNHLGVYATVLQPGTVSVGDRVEIEAMAGAA